MLFDVGKDGAKLASKSVVPEDQQETNESRRLWKSLTEAIINKDMDGATNSKTAVEEAQRESRRKLEEKGEKHVPRFFEEKNGGWVPKLECVPMFPSSVNPLAPNLDVFHGIQNPEASDAGSCRYCREVDLGYIHAASMMTLSSLPLRTVACSCFHLPSLHAPAHTRLDDAHQEPPSSVRSNFSFF